MVMSTKKRYTKKDVIDWDYMLRKFIDTYDELVATGEYAKDRALFAMISATVCSAHGHGFSNNEIACMVDRIIELTEDDDDAGGDGHDHKEDR